MENLEGNSSNAKKSIFGFHGRPARREQRETRVNREESGEQQQVAPRPCARPTPRGGSEKNAPLILHQRPAKKAAKNAALPIERPGPTHAVAVSDVASLRRVYTPPPGERRFFLLVSSDTCVRILYLRALSVSEGEGQRDSYLAGSCVIIRAC